MDDAFPRPEHSDHIDVQVEANAAETTTTETQPNVKEPDENKNVENSKTTSEKPSSSPATSFSLDTLFLLLILSVVISNPPRLVSHLLFTQRFLLTHTFRASSPSSSSAAGEQAYCLVNLMAVAEFIGNLDLEAVVWARQRPRSNRWANARTRSYESSYQHRSASIRSVLSSSFTLLNRNGQRVEAGQRKNNADDDDEEDEDMDGDSLHLPSQFDVDESDASEAEPIDTRSIKSFESMMSDRKRRAKARSANGNAAKPYPNHGSTYHS
ncbi:hypothetical protein F5878DRAFT_689385 [Lentinula raphanica]|uniref:VPS9 domain-containing protein n=1 Tax=Lentinula raphanica TaxID=153919 RepID=A0AA38UBH1_9AGAR|nr:hypothetical protein F5878DRAFT_689385 [Lentinula raphanica]